MKNLKNKLTIFSATTFIALSTLAMSISADYTFIDSGKATELKNGVLDTIFMVCKDFLALPLTALGVAMACMHYFKMDEDSRNKKNLILQIAGAIVVGLVLVNLRSILGIFNIK